MSLKVFVSGESGRMGQEVKKLVEADSSMQFVGGMSQENPEPVIDSSPDLVVDFSLPGNLPNLSQFILEHKCALVSGTTGLKEAEFSQLQELGKTASVFWAANMSFGVYLMCRLTETLARYQTFYEFQIEETHHIHKKDKPSGTALIIEEAAKKSTDQLKPTQSLRQGEVFGIHRFMANSKNESLEIRHEAFNRSLFAQGALDIGQWLVTKPAGFYGMDDFFRNFDK